MAQEFEPATDAGFDDSELKPKFEGEPSYILLADQWAHDKFFLAGFCFILTYDEGEVLYDHVPPQATISRTASSHGFASASRKSELVSLYRYRA